MKSWILTSRLSNLTMKSHFTAQNILFTSVGPLVDTGHYLVWVPISMCLDTVSESDLKLQPFLDLYHPQSTQKHCLDSHSQRSWCTEAICCITLQVPDWASLCHTHPCLETLVSTTVSLPTPENCCLLVRTHMNLLISLVTLSASLMHSSTVQAILARAAQVSNVWLLQLLSPHLDQAWMSGKVCQWVTAVESFAASLVLEAELLLLNLSQTSLYSAVWKYSWVWASYKVQLKTKHRQTCTICFEMPTLSWNNLCITTSTHNPKEMLK